MRLGLVSDSTSDLPHYLVEQYEIEIVPSVLIMAGKEHADGQTLSRQEFYDRLPDSKPFPTTAAPSIGDFSRRYDRLFSRGCDHILSLHASGALTTIVNTARQAASEYGNKLTVVDSRSLSLGLGFQVLAAAEAAEMGLEAALAVIESIRKRTRIIAALDTMEYLRRSGRLPALVTSLGGLFSIKPIIELTNEGVVKTIGSARTTGQADQRVLNILMEAGKLERLAVLHTGLESRARKLMDALMESARQSVPRDVLLVNVTPVIGAHVGPNGLGFAAVRADYFGFD